MAEPVCEIARAWVKAGAPEEDLARIEAHATTCATCARVVGADPVSEQELAARIARLPERISPPASAWPRVSARIAARSAAIARRRRATWGAGFALAAAAILVLALRPPRRAADEAPIASAPSAPTESSSAPAPAPAPSVAFDEEAAYASAADALRAELAAKQPSPKVLTVVDDNVRIVDDAIRAVRSALAAHPDDPELRADLDRAYQDKVDLLRTATELPDGVER